MMMPPKKCTVTKVFAALLLAGACSLALAGQVAGTIVHLSGPLMAKKADGTVKVLAARSEVEVGDTLVSEKNTYAQIKLIDNSEITLKPNTTFTVEAFSFDAGKPEGDSASFNLVKGGLRSITGLLGKRNKEKFQLKTPSATIGIRGTTFVAQYVAPPVPAVTGPASPAGPKPGPSLAPGLYVHVIDGMIIVTNPGGALGFAAGQFGYTPNFKQPPVLVPVNPGMQFTPPPAFSAPPPTASSGDAGKAKTVDCEVR